MSIIKLAFKLSRVRFWSYTAGTFLVGFTIAAGSLADFDSRFFTGLFYFLIIGNLFLYGINDYFDRDTDSLNIKKTTHEHLVQNKEIEQLRFLLIFCFFASLVYLFWLRDGYLVSALLLFLFLAIGYSTPPLRFKARPVLDFASNILYIMPGILGYYLASQQEVQLIPVLAGFFWAMAMHLFSAIPDIEPDRQAGVKTTAVLLGRDKSLLLTASLWLVFTVLVWTLALPLIFKLLSLVYVIIPLILLINKKLSVSRAYWWYPYINTGLGFILFVYFISRII
jgi:4-hydroxybenzoate polyprenyltransferase